MNQALDSSVKTSSRPSLRWPPAETVEGWLPWIVAAASLVLLAAGLLATHHVRAYTSDDVWLQTMMAHWKLHDGYQAWLSPDTFIIKVPLYYAIGHLMANTRASIFVTALVLNGVGLALFLSVFRYLIGAVRGERLVYLPVVWMAGLSMSLFAFLINPGLRNLEIGIAFVLIAAVARYTDGAFDGVEGLLRWLWLAGALVATGLFLYSDPLFFYLVVGPLAAFATLAAFWGGGRRRLYAAGFLAASFGFAQAWNVVFRALGIHALAANVSFATNDELVPHSALAGRGLLSIFDADVFGRVIARLATVRSLLNLALLVAIFLAPFLLRKARATLTWWQWFIVFQPFISVAVFILSAAPPSTNLTDARHLVLVPFFGALSLAFLIRGVAGPRAGLFPERDRRDRLQAAFAVVVLAALVLNAGEIYGNIRHHGPEPNASNLAVIQAVKGYGATKGYGSYWSGAINTYLSGNSITFVPVRCRTQGVALYHWNVDDSMAATPARVTFYLYDQNAQRFGGCRQAQLWAQLGVPTNVIPVGPGADLFVYDYDITSRILP